MSIFRARRGAAGAVCRKGRYCKPCGRCNKKILAEFAVRQQGLDSGRWTIKRGEGNAGGAGVRQQQRSAVAAFFLTDDGFGTAAEVPDHVGERRLLRTDQQQGEQQRKQRAVETHHGAYIKPQTRPLINLHQQALEVLAFGEGQVDRMVVGTLQPPDDARRAACLERGVSDDLLEQVDGDAA